MKTTSILIFIVLFQSIIFGQTGTITTVEVNKTKTNQCTVTFDGEKWRVDHKESNVHKCGELIITNVPPTSLTSTPIDLNISVKGFYTIKKDPSLVISDDYLISVEDLLTGQYYNLNSGDAYTFSHNRASRETRFVMEIKKNNPKSSSTALNTK